VEQLKQLRNLLAGAQESAGHETAWPIDTGYEAERNWVATG